MSALALRQHRVLVLNKNWSVISVTTLSRALKLLVSFCAYNGEVVPKAKIVTNDFQVWNWDDWARLQPKPGEDSLFGVKQAFKVPKIIVLTKYDKTPQQRMHFSRRAIYRRDNFQCQYCGCRPGSESLSIDHILPKSLGGLTTWENCCLSCTNCNLKKANRTPQMASMKLRSVPKKPKFSLFKGDRIVVPKDWEAFIGTLYWEAELENDEPK